MPEYLAPGVYVEETSYRAKSIEGVSTSTAGFVGQTLTGPVSGAPVLITSFEEFRRYYGDLDDLILGGVQTTNYLAHAVRAFFENGGKRVYVARVFQPDSGAGETLDDHTAAQATAYPSGPLFRARFAGRVGNLPVRVRANRGGNVLVGTGTAARLVGVRTGDVVEGAAALRSRIVRPTDTNDALQADTALDAVVAANLYLVRISDTGVAQLYSPAAPDTVVTIASTGHAVFQKVAVTVEVGHADRQDVYAELSTCPESTAFIGTVLRTEDHAAGVEAPYDHAARVWLDVPDTFDVGDTAALLSELMATTTLTLVGGSDGEEQDATTVTGEGSGHTATGLAALAEVDDIAIVAAPGGAGHSDPVVQQDIRSALISHCELLRYRVAILSADRNLDVAGIREARAQHDTSYAALYYPWVVVASPNGVAGDSLLLPPDGFVAGIWARSDIDRGVHKAPANETVRGIRRFSRPIDKATQDVLNPEGINCLRYFEGRGYRVWGARTLSSDPEWKYLNVRRLFVYLEHSIDKNTQWAVFEPNNDELWIKVRMTIESFLTDTWRTGALLGAATKDAFFVRCDRTTMTQGDLDNGRLICLIGVAPTKPAEFVIFRIGQWTADAAIA